MAHHTGFTGKSLLKACTDAGYVGTLCASTTARELWAIATKTEKTPQELDQLAKIYITPV